MEEALIDRTQLVEQAVARAMGVFRRVREQGHAGALAQPPVAPPAGSKQTVHERERHERHEHGHGMVPRSQNMTSMGGEREQAYSLVEKAYTR